jgi:hypothetical protein
MRNQCPIRTWKIGVPIGQIRAAHPVDSIMVVIINGHGGKDVLHGCDGWTDVSYRTDLANIFFENT